MYAVFQIKAADLITHVEVKVKENVTETVSSQAGKEAGSEVGQAVTEVLDEQFQKIDESTLEQVDSGIVEMQDFLRSFMLHKIDEAMVQMPDLIGEMLAAVHKVLIKTTQMTKTCTAAAETIVESEDASEAMLAQIEEIHAVVRAQMSKFVDGIVAMLNAMMGEPLPPTPAL